MAPASTTQTCLLYLALSFSFTALDSTPSPIAVGGTIGSDTYWTAGNVYRATSDITIPTNVWLFIDRNVIVKFEGNCRSNVNGRLILDSTASQRIVFTSWLDDEYGGDSDGASASPAPGNWGTL